MEKRKIFIIIAAVLIAAAGIVFTVKIIVDTRTEMPYVIYIPKRKSGTDFWVSLIAGAEMAAKENEATLEIVAPEEETDIEGQNRRILEAIEKKPDVIVVSPNSLEKNLEVLKQVKKAGIRLIYIDSVTSENIQDAIVATDNYQAGRKMGEYAKKNIDKSSVIGIVSHVKNSSTAEEREKGFRDALGDYASQIVEVVYSNSSYDIGYQEAMKLLEKYDIDCLACLNENSAVGAARAVVEKGLGGEILMIGFDNSTEEIKFLEEGVFSAIVVQRAYSMGYLGIETAVKSITQDTWPANIDSGSLLITKDNMYDPENQEVLFPFYGN